MDVNFHQISISFLLFSLRTIEWVKRQQPKREFSVLLFFFLFEAKTKSSDGKNPLTPQREDVTTRRDFFPFTFSLAEPFASLLARLYSPPFMTELFIRLFLCGVYNVQQQPTHRHLKDTDQMALCFYAAIYIKTDPVPPLFILDQIMQRV